MTAGIRLSSWVCMSGAIQAFWVRSAVQAVGNQSSRRPPPSHVGEESVRRDLPIAVDTSDPHEGEEGMTL